jgi:hypothetical protein
MALKLDPNVQLSARTRVRKVGSRLVLFQKISFLIEKLKRLAGYSVDAIIKLCPPFVPT